MAMRKTMTLIAMVLLLGGALSGCLGSAEDAEPQAGDGDEGEQNQNDWDQMPANRSGEYAAFRETNKTEDGSGGMAHDHDYWQGRSRVTLFQTTAEMPPAPGAGGSSVVFRPPPPALVYEGTGYIEITISNPQRHACYPYLYYGGEFICTSNTGHWAGVGGEGNYAPEQRELPPMEVSFIHGASNPDDWIAAGTIEWDTPLRIEVQDAVWTDMPHATATLWAFKFDTAGPMDGTLVFDVQMDLVRSEKEEIPVWPGHPDFYADRDHRKVMDLGGRSTDGYGSTRTADLLRPEKLISYGTNTLHVWVNITSLTSLSEGDAPSHWYLRYHNASWTNDNITDPYDDARSGDLRELYWVLQVDPQGMDSPYATESRWEFQLRGAFTVPGVISCIGGCMPPYEVEYNMALVATSEKLAPEEYDISLKA